MCVLPLPKFSPEHIHPILVNFTAALIPASVGSDVAGRLLRRVSLHTAAWWMLVYAAATTPLTAFAGWWWKQRAGDTLSPQLILWHERIGFGLVFAFFALAIWRYAVHQKREAPGMAYLLFGGVLVVVLVMQGTLGGAMLFGI